MIKIKTKIITPKEARKMAKEAKEANEILNIERYEKIIEEIGESITTACKNAEFAVTIYNDSIVDIEDRNNIIDIMKSKGYKVKPYPSDNSSDSSYVYPILIEWDED